MDRVDKKLDDIEKLIKEELGRINGDGVNRCDVGRSDVDEEGVTLVAHEVLNDMKYDEFYPGFIQNIYVLTVTLFSLIIMLMIAQVQDLISSERISSMSCVGSVVLFLLVVAVVVIGVICAMKLLCISRRHKEDRERYLVKKAAIQFLEKYGMCLQEKHGRNVEKGKHCD